MKIFKLVLIPLFFASLFSSCEKPQDDETEIQRTTNLVSLNNNIGATGCSNELIEVTFIISYRDIQVDVDIKPDRNAIINVLVEDGESINVRVQKTSDDTLLSDANVNVRTTSRPEHLEDAHRQINYCEAFNIIFANF